MYKYIQKHLDFKLINASIVFAALYCFLYNSAVFAYKFSYVETGIFQLILELFKDLVYNFVLLFIIFFGLSVHRIIFIVGSLFLFITGAIASYYLYFFSVAPTLAIMPSVFGTETQELTELISVRIIVWVIFSILICLYSVKHFKIETTKSFVTRILSAICLLIFINNIISPKFSFIKSYFPMQYLHNAYIHLFGEIDEDFSKIDISKEYAFEDKSDSDVIVVLVIGEAARYDRFAINGYEKDTTPNLANIENLASYKARSCSNTTYLSVPCMLSKFSEDNMSKIDSETSILSIFTKLGFETMWFGTQSITKYYRNKPGGSFYDEVNFHVTPGGTALMLPNSHDCELLPYLEKNISSNKKKFIILHTTGSHWNYKARYPKEFEKFTPVVPDSSKLDAASCSSEERNNSYDNSILYTDFFLSNVISMLKDKNAILIYASDHGESLGEEGRLTHGHDEYHEEQRNVPFMVWFSNKYKSNHHEKWDSIKYNLGKNISHDYLFHSILDCLNIESSIVEKSLSLCRSQK